jgi:hypothetical protein
MGLEWAHAEFLSQGEGLLVVGFGLHGIGGVGVGLDNAKLVQCARRHWFSLMGTSMPFKTIIYIDMASV